MRLTLRERYSKENIVCQKEFDGKDPLVSIVAICYNHGKFVRDAIEGFLIQETDFPVELIIHDDCSTDNSAKIIRDYEKQYPDLFHTIYQKENQYSKGVHIWGDVLFPKAKGKYIAICETDDYWTDSDKLQKQVDFLEAHPDYSMCFHNATVIYPNKPSHPYADIKQGEYLEQDLAFNWNIATNSMLYRKEVLTSDIYNEIRQSKKLSFGDRPLGLACARCGRVFGFSDIMGVYRQHDGGWTHAHTGLYSIPVATTFIEMGRIFGAPTQEFANHFLASSSPVLYKLLLKGEFAKFRHLIKNAFKYAPMQTLKNLLVFYPKVFIQKLHA